MTLVGDRRAAFGPWPDRLVLPKLLRIFQRPKRDRIEPNPLVRLHVQTGDARDLAIAPAQGGVRLDQRQELDLVLFRRSDQTMLGPAPAGATSFGSLAFSSQDAFDAAARKDVPRTF